MKKDKMFVIIVTAIIVISIVASLILYSRLPEKMASHWNARGEVDDYMPRIWGAFLMPVVMLLLALLLFFIPKIDPLKQNILKFKDYYYAFITFLSAYLLLVHLHILLWNAGIKISINISMSILSGPLFYFVGILLEKAKRNWFIGIRTPWTLSSDTVWEKTHKQGSVLFKICGVLSVIGAFFGRFAVYFIIVPVLAVSLYLIVYSYVEFQKENNRTNSR